MPARQECGSWLLPRGHAASNVALGRATADAVEAKLLKQAADGTDMRARTQRTAERRAATAPSPEEGRARYDSAERRHVTARELETLGLDQELVATRMRADVSQAKPVSEAIDVGAGTTSAKARKNGLRAAKVQCTIQER